MHVKTQLIVLYYLVVTVVDTDSISAIKLATYETTTLTHIFYKCVN